MNWNEIEAQWTHMTVRLKRHWLRLTDADLKAVAGKRPNLISAIEKRYGLLYDDAEKQVRDWTLRLGPAKPSQPPPAPPSEKSGVRPADSRSDR